MFEESGSSSVRVLVADAAFCAKSSVTKGYISARSKGSSNFVCSVTSLTKEPNHFVLLVSRRNEQP